MTETTDTAARATSGGRKGGLNSMLLPELKQLAGGLGIKATGMRKGDLIEAIKAAQSGGPQWRPEQQSGRPRQSQDARGRPERRARAERRPARPGAQ